MATISMFCENCNSIITINVNDIQTVHEVLSKLHESLICPKCKRKFESEDGTINMIPFNTKLIPAFLELSKKGYLISIHPSANDEHFSIHITVKRYCSLSKDEHPMYDLTNQHPLGLNIMKLQETISTVYALVLPVVLSDDDIDELFEMAKSLKTLESELVIKKSIKVYEINFSDLI